MNDEALIRKDGLAMGLQNGELFQYHRFTLLERNEDGAVKKVLYEGMWQLSENGYLGWPTTVAPKKDYIRNKDIEE